MNCSLSLLAIFIIFGPTPLFHRSRCPLPSLSSVLLMYCWLSQRLFLSTFPNGQCRKGNSGMRKQSDYRTGMFVASSQQQRHESTPTPDSESRKEEKSRLARLSITVSNMISLEGD